MIHGRSGSTPSRRRLPPTLSLMLWLFSSAVPATVLWVLLQVEGTVSGGVTEILALGSVAWAAIVALGVRAALLRRIRTLSNLVEAARAHDYSIKAAHAHESGELGELHRQINSLIGDLEAGRHTEQELLGMLQKVVNQISVAIVVCDAYDRIRLVNPLAAKLLQSSADALMGIDFASTALAAIPFSAEPRVLDFRFPSAESRWQVSQQSYRHQGKPSRIIFIADLKQVLVGEEIVAWQRLIRVISHEVNNSLTPIMSLCQTLETMVSRPDSEAKAEVVRDGLSVISQRAKGLKEFISIYARIARLPEPQKTLFSAARLADKVQAMFPQVAVERVGSIPEFRLFGDQVQLEQVLINLIKNALEANEGSATPVQFSGRVRDEHCEFEIVDSGAGISNPGNLFVPFYTTKANGAGVGLTLCRKIAAQHFGQVTLENRHDGQGAIARLVLPLPPPQQEAADPTTGRRIRRPVI